MVSKELVGTRIRQVRTAQRKTLKDVEASSGFSSTHISEIERGRTSPTIGALVRIAHALDKDPSFFIEERELDEVCVTSEENRPEQKVGLALSGNGLEFRSLTRGILGGRLLAYELLLGPSADGKIARLPETGDLCLVCVEGGAELKLRDRTLMLHATESLHVPVEDADLRLRSQPEGRTRILIMMDPREALS